MWYSCRCVCVCVWLIASSHRVSLIVHTQESKVKEAIGFYEQIVKKYFDNVRTCDYHMTLCLPLVQILGVSAIVLANLCVAYVLTSQTEEVVATAPVIEL